MRDFFTCFQIIFLIHKPIIINPNDFMNILLFKRIKNDLEKRKKQGKFKQELAMELKRD